MRIAQRVKTLAAESEDMSSIMGSTRYVTHILSLTHTLMHTHTHIQTKYFF